MAKTKKEIRLEETKDLYEASFSRITESGDNFFEFLSTGCYHYDKPFIDQVLIAAQRPGAVALTRIENWNKRGFKVKKGTRSIAVLEGWPPSEAKEMVHYFDISDVEPAPWAKNVPTITMWKYDETAHGPDVRYVLSEQYGVSKDAPLEEMINAAIQQRMDIMLEEESFDIAGGLSSEEMDLARKVAAYSVLSRARYDTLGMSGKDFEEISRFNAPVRLMNVLSMSIEAAGEVTKEIGRAVLEKNKELLREGRTGEYAAYRVELQAGRGFSGAGSKEVGNASDREVREEESGVHAASSEASAGRADADGQAGGVAGLSEQRSDGDGGSHG